MGKIGLIIRREYLTRVRKKSFIVMTILGPLLFAGMIIGAIAIGMTDEEEHEVIIADLNGVISRFNEDQSLESRFPRRFKDSDKIRYHFSNFRLEDEEFRESPYSIMIELDDQTVNDGYANLYFKKLPSALIRRSLEREVQSAIEEFRVRDSLKMDYEAYQRIKQNIHFVMKDIDKSDETDLTQERAAVGFVFAIIIYFFIFMYGVQVMRGVIEEKTNRIVEILVSSVRPFELMMGKITGIGLVGLTQFLLWVVFSLVIYSLAQSFYFSESLSPSAVVEMNQLAQAGQGTAQPQDWDTLPVINIIQRINWAFMIGMFVIYFLGGYLIYASLFAAIGAAVDAETDTQQFMLPVTIPLVFGFIVSEFLLQNPEGTVGTIFSIIPLTSPIVIMLKSAMWSGGSVWLFVISILALILTFLFTTWIAGRIYRVGILMYGKKASYKELWKWLFYKN